MIRPLVTLLLIVLGLPVILGSLHAKENRKMPPQDTGKESIGKIKAILYIGSNADIATLGKKVNKSKPIPNAEVQRLQRIPKMHFKHYRKLGEDIQSVFRSYENWLSPLKPSEEILISFESQGCDDHGDLRLDLELWLQHRKVMKGDPILRKGQPLLILGPKWRGATLIIAVELITLRPQLSSKPQN
jgi:hypothetical protein